MVRIPRSTRIALLAAASTILAQGQSGPASAEQDAQKERTNFHDVMSAEARSPQLCLSRPNRAYVTHRYGSSCMAYFVTSGHQAQRQAVVFIDGDISGDRYDKRASDPDGNLTTRQRAQKIADKFKVRVIVISRMGIDGSSGNHGSRRRPVELMAITETLDVIKSRLGLDRVVLAGQSGGSTIAASLLTLGRKDISCAVLGSGAYALNDMLATSAIAKGRKPNREMLAKTVYDPTRNIATIHADPKRRVFVLGDPQDARTPFAQQKAFAAAIAARGHTAELLEVLASGPLHHGATAYTLPVAALCAADAPSERIRKGILKHKGHEIERRNKVKSALLTVAR
ncbi:MAG: hypothetical protein KDJ47_12365 [Hyphomicrobiaceae bacterium]|nr:hypothetical protein [Hyphomicrobiaceae bacterium]